VDTISTIAFRFGVDPKVIINYAPNQLDGIGINTPLEPGRSVMVPGGIKPIRDTLILYKVRDGETLDYIASKFGVTKETIATFNDDKIVNNQVSGGMELVILPISGIRVTVQPGDSVTTIANRFKVPVDNITGLPMNNITKDTKLKAGDKLVIPNGLVPAAPIVAAPVTGSTKPGTGSIKDVGRYIPPPPVPAVNRNPNGALSAPPPGVPVGTTGKMVWPVYGPITTYFGQRIWYGIHQGLDIAAPVNTPIVAADGGVVLNAGWTGDGYGIMVLIAHSNGLYTLYGHLNRTNVAVGQKVARGQLIGIEGSTGNSTGPHLHFEVRWGRVYGQTLNPLSYLK
jgi:murein DD-endopeptidase MepM/ murein hydrolase activator NlpD